jgi:hypothetical protein
VHNSGLVLLGWLADYGTVAYSYRTTTLLRVVVALPCPTR